MKEFKKANFDNEQEYLMAILEYVSEEGQDCFDNLSPDEQTWFNENVDLVSEEKKLDNMEVIGDTFPNTTEAIQKEIPEEVTEEIPFGEVENENSFQYEDIIVDNYVELEIEDGKVIIGKVIKVMKSALRIDLNGEDIRIAKKKITNIISIDKIESITVDTDTVDTDTVDTDTVDTDTVDTDTVNTDTVNTDTVNTDTVNTDTVNTDTVNTDTVRTTSFSDNCKCNDKDNKIIIKQILNHMSEIMRLASELI